MVFIEGTAVNTLATVFFFGVYRNRIRMKPAETAQTIAVQRISPSVN